ncbi:DNA (cytosine-5-)-methyltransferase [Arthrobacter sp. MYb227]|nr:DNA (cytosine-5-)-methyltransferase [Arthrobacter sp. MYb227]
MSLGLHASGFELAMANELSPMAAETFAYNHLNVDLQASSTTTAKSVLWLGSKYPRTRLKDRLRENPYDYPDWASGGYTDIPASGLTGQGQLVVGSIVSLNKHLKEEFIQHPQRRNRFSVDLVSGGPPCQSFSMAGLRQRDNHRNQLPWEFASFVKLVRPKVALLENVSGILRAFRQDGEEFHAWREVAKAFTAVGYAPICIHANAKYVGVAQNRPRFLMFAVRKDLAESIIEQQITASERSALQQALDTFDKNFDWNLLRYWDVAQSSDQDLFDGSIFRHLLTTPDKNNWTTAEDAISDLENITNKNIQPSIYVNRINETFGKFVPRQKIKNIERRKHGLRVQQRFRLYQVLEGLGDRSLSRAIAKAFKDGDQVTLSQLASPLLHHKFLFAEGQKLRLPADVNEIVSLVVSLRTKKHSQRALIADRPSPAALSIPDDCCHYSSDHLRTLSVREVARIQSFPDSFEFRSKVTTGGDSRKFEVPQYTQAGNAVPPLLAKQAGEVVQELLRLATPTEQAVRLEAVISGQLLEI